MRIDWRTDKNAPAPCRVIRTDTGECLSPCAMADEETGEYERYDVAETLPDGCLHFNLDPQGLVKTVRGVAPLKIVHLKGQ